MASDLNRRIAFSLLFLSTVILYGHKAYSKCDFEAIFNFGDSNSDTGGFWAAFPAQSGPWGMIYFKKPAGRASDGRLIIDFLEPSGSVRKSSRMRVKWQCEEVFKDESEAT